MQIPFIVVTPGDRIENNIKLVLTTRKEEGLIDSKETICIEDLGEDSIKAKGRILSSIYRGEKDELVLGIDPGMRIGFVAFYKRKELDSAVLGSVEELLKRAKSVIENTKGRKVAKVGNGDPSMARGIMEHILRSHGDMVEVEIVDEKGTSKARDGFNRRGLLDLHSARLIALRKGKKISGIDNLQPAGLRTISRQK